MPEPLLADDRSKHGMARNCSPSVEGGRSGSPLPRSTSSSAVPEARWRHQRSVPEVRSLPTWSRAHRSGGLSEEGNSAQRARRGVTPFLGQRLFLNSYPPEAGAGRRRRWRLGNACEGEPLQLSDDAEKKHAVLGDAIYENLSANDAPSMIGGRHLPAICLRILGALYIVYRPRTAGVAASGSPRSLFLRLLFVFCSSGWRVDKT